MHAIQIWGFLQWWYLLFSNLSIHAKGSESRKLSLKSHFRFVHFFARHKLEFCLEPLCTVVRGDCLPFCFSPLSPQPSPASNQATGEKWTRVDRVGGFPGETGKRQRSLPSKLRSKTTAKSLTSLWSGKLTCALPATGAQPQHNLSTFKMQPALVLELIQDWWPLLTRNQTEPMPGCNKCQNIHATYAPHNADGEDGEIACH